MIDILGVQLSRVSFSEAQATLASWLETNENHVIVTPNPEAVMIARRDSEFANALNAADLSLADGTGILLASRYLNRALPERVRGIDTIFALLENRELTAYFLGGVDGIAEEAKNRMEARFPKLRVLGFHHGFFTEDAKIIEEINRLSPDILLVCTGMPRAEIWAIKNRHIKARLTMCLGGTLDVMAGKARLAPAWLRRMGLEWLYRLLTNPARWRRMLNIPCFVWAVLRSK